MISPSGNDLLQGSGTTAILVHALASAQPVRMLPIALVTALLSVVATEYLLTYMPGGWRNPYNAVTVDRLHYHIKIGIWVGIVLATAIVYGAGVWLMVHVS